MFAAALAEMESALSLASAVPEPIEGRTLEDELDGLVLLVARELWERW